MIIAIANQKGGVGKTTTTHNVGIALAEKKKKVLLIDIDPQTDLSMFVGADELEHDGTIVDVLEGKADIEAVKLELKPNLDIVVSSEFLSATQSNLGESDLKNALDKVKSKYDYILIDCPPNLGTLTINAFIAADYVIIPSKTDYASYTKISRLEDTLEEIKNLYNPNLEILGVVATFYKMVSKNNNAILKTLKENYNVLGIIRDRVIVEDGVIDGLSVIETSPTNEVSKEYKKVANQIIKRG